VVQEAEVVGLDSTLIKNMSSAFEERVADCQRKLERAVQGRSWTAIREIVHEALILGVAGAGGYAARALAAKAAACGAALVYALKMIAQGHRVEEGGGRKSQPGALVSIERPSTMMSSSRPRHSRSLGCACTDRQKCIGQAAAIVSAAVGVVFSRDVWRGWVSTRRQGSIGAEGNRNVVSIVNDPCVQACYSSRECPCKLQNEIVGVLAELETALKLQMHHHTPRVFSALQCAIKWRAVRLGRVKRVSRVQRSYFGAISGRESWSEGFGCDGVGQGDVVEAFLKQDEHLAGAGTSQRERGRWPHHLMSMPLLGEVGWCMHIGWSSFRAILRRAEAAGVRDAGRESLIDESRPRAVKEGFGEVSCDKLCPDSEDVTETTPAATLDMIQSVSGLFMPFVVVPLNLYIMCLVLRSSLSF
jgi:hypothetical protein